METAKYLVPFDFSEVASVAVKYAVQIGKITGAEIFLVNIISDKSTYNKTDKKLEEAIDKMEVLSNIKYTKIIKVGNIYTDINKIAVENGVQLIIMGTHGSHGFQWLFGSFAMKVVTSSTIPFLIVQKETVIEKIDRILVPIDVTSESLQITSVAADLASLIDAEISIVHEPPRDSLFRNKFKMHASIIEKAYEKKGMKYSWEELSGKGASYKKLMHYAVRNNCKMLSIAYFSDALFPQFDTFAQNLITNRKHLPCLIINAVPTSNSFYK